MKFIKVTALAAAMMTTFGAQAELAAMDDAALEAVTGQQSINVTLTNGTAGNILTTDFAYDDADGVGTAGNAGSLFLENTAIAGTGGAGNDELAVTIDVDGAGGAEALVIGVEGLSVAGTTIGIASGNATAFGTTADIHSIGRTALTFNGTISISVDAAQ